MNIIDGATTLARGPIGTAKLFLAANKAKIIIAFVAAALAIGGFLVWQNGNLFNKVVDAKVEVADQKATIDAHVVKDRTAEAGAQIDDDFEKRQTITQKEYVHVRTIIREAPVESRNRQADPLIIDTLNGLERMSRGGAETPDAVHNSDDPVG